MRLRRKPWARPALESCNFFIPNPTDYIGKWNSVFETTQELHLELGCGKGGFISQLASVNRHINYIAIDIKDEVLILAKEKIDNLYLSQNLQFNNIRIMSHEIMLIHRMIDHNDGVSRIYINFCNPWYKNQHRVRRLTHPKQLNQYNSFLVSSGQIWFKTDDLQLFTDSVNYFNECKFKIAYITNDLHNSSFTENIMTEHEKMYLDQGNKINFLIAEKST
jgi:tRNA (guanine-N7-)-methyltransferase